MKKALFSMILIVFLSVSFCFLQKLLVPKYVTENKEGALIREYYDNAGNNDVIFIGDCEVYESFSPPYLWKEFGITSYIRGSANQTIWQSYYLLSETLEYEKPKVVVFNVLSMKYDSFIKEEYNRLTLDGMRLSKHKIASIKASMNPEERMADYIFPILRYHERYDELNEEDFKYLFNKPEVSYKGYLMKKDVVAYSILPSKIPLTDYAFSKLCYDYLDRMTKLCKENNIKLILVKAPTLYPYWYEEWDSQIKEYANDNELTYINFQERVSEIGIDYSADTYDGGLHLNVYGAEKLTRCLGEYLKNSSGIEFGSYDEKTHKEWDSLYESYTQEKRR